MDLNITSEQIVNHREARKKAGLVGCQDGSDQLFGSLRGISWRRDTKGRESDHPEFDPDDPHCFCHDCRRSFDPDGTHDLKIINMGNPEAIRVYASLIQPLLPKRSNGGGITLAPPPPRILHRINWPPAVETKETPLSLTPPRERDILNESPKQRINNDLSALRGYIQNKLIVVMDSRRRAVAMSEEERDEYLDSLHEKEAALWAKLDAVDLLLKD